METDKPTTMRGGRKKTSMLDNRYGDDFLIDKIKPDEIGADKVRVGDLVPDLMINSSGKRIAVCVGLTH